MSETMKFSKNCLWIDIFFCNMCDKHINNGIVYNVFLK